MSQLSQNFYRSEFACPCCGFNTVDSELVDILQDIREFFDKPVEVTSGCRCPSHNKKVGGGKKSQHLFGRAADIQVQDVAPHVVQEYCHQIDVPGLGCYDDFTHIDTRTGFARWEG